VPVRFDLLQIGVWEEGAYDARLGTPITIGPPLPWKVGKDLEFDSVIPIVN
jgi:hypothetical protein